MSRHFGTTRRGRRTRALAALLAVGLVSGCSDKDHEERCEEMADYLEGREQMLEYDCQVDIDCEVVLVRPDRPIAARDQPHDPALDRVVAEYRDRCAPIPRADVSALTAVCEERIVEIADPLDPTVAIPVSLGRSCMLRGDWSVPDAGNDVGVEDAGMDVLDTTDTCACTSNAECATGESCHACSCVPATVCGEACIRADECGLLTDLGLGVTARVCALSCDASSTDSPAYQAFAQCLRTASCTAMESCESALP